jgi:hypothetical protein
MVRFVPELAPLAANALKEPEDVDEPEISIPELLSTNHIFAQGKAISKPQLKMILNQWQIRGCSPEPFLCTQ